MSDERDTRDMNQERGFFIDLMVGFLVFLMVSSGLSVHSCRSPPSLVPRDVTVGNGNEGRGKEVNDMSEPTDRKTPSGTPRNQPLNL